MIFLQFQLFIDVCGEYQKLNWRSFCQKSSLNLIFQIKQNYFHQLATILILYQLIWLDCKKSCSFEVTQFRSNACCDQMTPVPSRDFSISQDVSTLPS